MNPRIASCFVGLAVLAIAPVPAWADGKTIHIYNWNDYIAPNTLEDFTKATGIKTTYDVYDALEVLEQKLLVEHSGYDVVVPTAEPTLSRLIKAKAVQKLDKSKIPNFQNLDPDLNRLVAKTDPGNQFGAIYQWGTIGIGINPERIKALAPDAPLDSWDLLFKPENAARLEKCGITFLDSQIDVIPTVLHYLGLDPNSEKPEDLAKVEALLLKLRPHIKAFVTGQNINMLAGGDACVVFSYSGDALQARDRAKEAGGQIHVDYIIPKEGAQVWFDTMAMPVDAPNADEALAYINFILTPEVMAGISNTVHYANAVPASLPLLDEAVRNDPVVYPPPEVRAKLFTVAAVSQAAERARTRLWTRIKTGH